MPSSDTLSCDRARTQSRDEESIPDRINEAVAAFTREIVDMRLSLLREIEALSRKIALAREEIGNLRLDDGGGSGLAIPAATDELDAIVEHTARATDTILGAAEALNLLAEGLEPAVGDAITDQTMCILEACSFQDITGQRMSKIVMLLKTIEAEVAALAGGERRRIPIRKEAGDTLLNGPQLEDIAMSQDAIDKLLTG